MRALLIGVLSSSVAVASGLSVPVGGQNQNLNATEAGVGPNTGHPTAPPTSQAHRVHEDQASKSRTRPPSNVRPTGHNVIGATPRASSPEQSVHVEKATNGPAESRAKNVGHESTVRKPSSAQPVPDLRPPRPSVSHVPRPGTEPPLTTQPRPAPKPQWNTNWRDNHRYDWHNWRRHHHGRFHLHPYIDPFGWGYFRYWIGWRLWPRYYASTYWIGDPWYYRLPPAPPGTRWVRYYNDALLVDIWTGEVVDVIHDFFW